MVKGRRCPLLVVYDRGEVRALDNRCPHLGFPLHKGSIQDGILTCHWHHARFDLASGGTFDLWADDVPTAEVRIEDGEVWVAAECRLRDDPAVHWRRRLRDGMDHDLGLVIAKAVLGARAAGVDDLTLVRDAALFGARMRDGFGIGMTILTALANVLPALPEEEGYLALFQGIRRVAQDCAGQEPRRDREPLRGSPATPGTLRRWFRQWTEVRHRDAAERTLLTAIASGRAGRARRSDARRGHRSAVRRWRPRARLHQQGLRMHRADRREHAAAILPTVVAQLVAARGSDELNAWRHPIDLVPLMAQASEALPEAFAEGRTRAERFVGHAALAADLLGEEPAPIIDVLLQAIRAGALASDLARALAYAAALRIARFGTANEFSDWDTALHAFTYANAVHQLLKHAEEARPSPESDYPLGVRGVFHGAMALYLTRYLNQPPAAFRASAASTWMTCPKLQASFAARCSTPSIAGSRSIRAPGWSPAIWQRLTRASP